ncbi:hybrid sensor histidine kinase/response regulator transcription factor [Dysgonomonas reticulitermitis]
MNFQVSAFSGYYFKQISLEDGLSQSTVACIVRDHKGIIWIGTRFGLNCYDGEQMRNFYYENNNNQSLPSNEIIFLTEDDNQNLWIGTSDGIALYDRHNNCFKHILFEASYIVARCSLLVDDGVIFFASNKAYKYSYSDESISLLPFIIEDGSSVYVDNCCIYDKEKKTILLSSRYDGVWSYNIASGKLTRFAYIPYKNITTMFIDSFGSIWISLYGEGLICYNKEGKIEKHFSTKNILNNNVVKGIIQRKDELWIATDGGGLNIYNLHTGQVQGMMHMPGEVHSLPENSLMCLYNDPGNNVWIGSIRGGLIGMKEIFIKTYKDIPFNSNYGLSDKTVNTIFEDNDNFIWLGTDGGGINRFDPKTNLFQHYPSTYNSKVVSITRHNKNELLLSIFDDGLYLFNKKNGTLREYTIMDEDMRKTLFRSGKSVNINKIDSENLYLYTDNVWLYNQSKKELEPVTDIEGNTSGFVSLNLIQGNRYVSYLRNPYGIYEIDHIQNKINKIYSSDGSIGTILNVCIDTKGNFWIGTTMGLYSYNLIQRQLKRIENELLVGSTALAFDKSGRLWVGTHNAMYIYDPVQDKVILVGEADGVSPNEYISTSTLLSSLGDIFIAGTKGLLYIENNFSFSENKTFTITLLDILLDGASVGLEKTDGYNTISVPWDYTSLSAKVMIKESDLMCKKMFRFYIKGEQEEVIEIIEVMNNTISFSSLATGDYSIAVSCMKNNGDWSEPVQLFAIKVIPPWWKTTWFSLISLLFILIFVGLSVWYTIKNKERKMAWAMKEHEQKTYEEKVRFLINISHELRTPLTLVFSPLKQLLSSGSIQNESYNKILNSILSQVYRIKQIINMTLDVHKMEMGGERVNISKNNLNEWIKSIAIHFENELEINGIILQFSLFPTECEVPFDSDKCEIVLSNLLMNAIKFSGQDTAITISTSVRGAYFRVSVSDEGIGLSESDISNLFTRFYQGDHGYKGTGIGLSYSKILVEMHGGKIGAFNNEKKGATFFYDLPLENQITHIIPGSFLNELFMSDKIKNVNDENFTINKYSVLIVEDEPELRTYLKNTLREHFKHVYVAEDGEKALHIALHNLPDIIVSDVLMPKMNGFEFCKQVKSNLKISHIPIILLTAWTDSENTKQGYKLGADMYIPKPFDVDFLLIILRNQLMNCEYIKQKYKQHCILSPKEETISNADEQFITRLNAIINETIEDPRLDVNFISRNMAMSRSALNTKLKLLTDISIGEYINKFRMMRAVQLLSNKSLSIQDISEKTGFTNQRYFSTVFKKIYGTTPSLYRNDLFEKKDHSSNTGI